MNSIDVTSLIVALEHAIGPVVLAFVVRFAWTEVSPFLTKYLGEKNMLAFQQRFDIVADKAIGYAVNEGSKKLTTGAPITVHDQGWMVDMAVNYLVSHAPEMAEQAGELSQKILARFDSHPAVQGLIGAPPPAPEPVIAGS